MNKNARIHERIENALELGRWYTLDEILELINSSSKSYVKMTLFAMDTINIRKVWSNDPKAPRGTWLWQFCRQWINKDE